MTIIDTHGTHPQGPDEPEEPTNRPTSRQRVHEWLSRPYAKPIVWLSVVMTILVIPLGWVVVYFMNLSGAPASDTMAEIESTIIAFTIICSPLMGVTLAIMLYSWFGWGRVHGDAPPLQENPKIRENRTANYLWVTTTGVLAAILATWGMIELARLTSYSFGAVPVAVQPSSQKPLIINVTGQQWVWSFDYPDYGDIAPDTLVVPEGRPVYFNVTSVDVIHDFWIVELGVKIDANPGAVTNTGVTPNKLGTFNIRCAELCGLHHAYMETQIKVVTPQEFDAWVRESGGKRTA